MPDIKFVDALDGRRVLLFYFVPGIQGFRQGLLLDLFSEFSGNGVFRTLPIIIQPEKRRLGMYDSNRFIRR